AQSRRSCTDAPLFDNNTLKVGTYRLTFDVAVYFKARGVELPEPSFLNKVSSGLWCGQCRAALPRACWSALEHSTYRGS
ncbi:hypothetical protein J4711_14505, partial [Staphylococcus epidermidis]|nr:hypothetical protein [Staphylococcus epidermidis]